MELFKYAKNPNRNQVIASLGVGDELLTGMNFS